MSVYGAQNYTNFSGVNIKGSIALRVGNPSDSYEGTLSIKGASMDGARDWHFPDKSGTFPIAGTFQVQLPAAQAAAFFSTVVTVTGITAEDALICQLNSTQGYDFDNSTGHILVASQPGAGQVTLFFQNLGNATGYVQMNVSYIAVR